MTITVSIWRAIDLDALMLGVEVIKTEHSIPALTAAGIEPSVHYQLPAEDIV